MKPRAGFTLLEIMVVVFILGLLATLVAPRIMGRTDEARAEYERALALAHTEPERRFLRRRVAEVSA